MEPDDIYKALSDLFDHSGFNLTRRIEVGEYHRHVPQHKYIATPTLEAKSLILVGFAGKSFWNVLQKFLLENPQFRDTREDWIDNYTLLKFEPASKILKDEGVNYRMIYPFGSEALSLDFLNLGELAGVGVQSLLGILLHPEYGTWISLRGVIITDLEFTQYDNPLTPFNPCPTCSKPCISACPANTISEKGWNWKSCMMFRLSSDTCSTSCASRRACPYGKEHQYSEEQLAHHHKFVLRSVKKYWGSKR